MSVKPGDEAAQAGFNNPFIEDKASSQVPATAEEEVIPRRNRSIAEDTAREEDVAPSDAAPRGSGPDSGPHPDSRQIAFAEPKVSYSSDDIEKLSQHDSPTSDSSLSRDHAHGEAFEKIKTTATKVVDKFHLSNLEVTGPSSLFNPTNVRARLKWNASNQTGDNADFDLLWRSRDNRKGRGSIAVRSSVFEDPASRRRSARKEKALSHLRNIANNLKRMFTTFPYWDMAFWGGWSYTIGSALFVLDGAFAWTPAAFPDNEFEGEETYGVPLCFFFGALFFQIGATMAYFEAINDGSFHGSAMRRLMEGHEDDQKKILDEKIHSFFGSLKPHHHKDPDEEAAEKLAADVDPEAGWNTKDRNERPGSIYPPAKHPGRRRGAMDMGEAEEGQSSTYLTWRWWPR